MDQFITRLILRLVSRSTITPSGRTWIVQGGNQGYSISANQGYRITHVYVDTVDQGSISSYTFYDVQQAHTISVTSEVIPASYTLTVLSVDDGTQLGCAHKRLFGR